MGKGFLSVDVLAELHRRHGGGVVGMVRSGDGYHVDLVIEFGQHLAVVLISGGALELFGPGVDLAVLVIDVAQAQHFHVLVLGQVSRIHAALASGPDMGGANFAVG